LRLRVNPVKVSPLKNWHICAIYGRNTEREYLRQNKRLFTVNDSHIKWLKFFKPNPARAAEGFYFCAPIGK